MRKPNAISSIIQSCLLYLASILVALVVGAVLIVVSSPSVLGTYTYFVARPGTAIESTFKLIGSVYYALLTGALGTGSGYLHFASHPSASAAQTAFTPLSETFLAAGPLILAGLGIAVALRAGLINVGGQGQSIVAGLAAAIVGFSLPLPFPLPLVLATLAAIAMGGAWGAITGLLKAKFGAHEVVTTIMMNYVAINLTTFLLGLPALQRPGRTDPLTPSIVGAAQFPPLFGASFRVTTGFLVAIAIVGVVQLAIFHSTSGLELRSVGQSQSASSALGIDRKRVWVMALAASGGLIGLAAAVDVLGVEHSASPGTAGFLGIDALLVALLGRASPLGCCFAGLFIGALQAGGTQMQATTGVPLNVVEVIEAVAVLLIASPKLISLLFRIKRVPAATSSFRGWAS